MSIQPRDIKDYHRRCAELLRYIANHPHTQEEAYAAAWGAEHHEAQSRRLDGTDAAEGSFVIE